jgi:hypothetical protein
MKSLRTITAVVATAALAGGVAAPAFAQTAGSYPTDSTTTQASKHGKKGKHKQRKLSDAQLTTVATALGTTLDALKAAQAKVKAATDATDARETKAQVDALLASELGVTVDQVRTAFDGVRGGDDGRGGRGGTCNGGKPASGSAGSYPTDSGTSSAN